jgi:hypothetical protein
MKKLEAFNPFLPSYEYIPDGEPRVFNERIYIFGSHDAFGGSFYCQNDYVCWSAPVDDLGNWKFEGTIYQRTQDPLSKTADDDLLQAPDVIQGVDGKYYLYYSMASTDIISVAVCDSPAGCYEFYGYVHYPNGDILGKREGDLLQFDPGIYVEGERVFLYSGFCPSNTYLWESKKLPIPKFDGAMVVELEKDMLTVKKEPSIIAPYVNNSTGTGYEKHEFFEAPSMRKVNDKYYFIYSSINGHELCYAISNYPDKDFVFGGTIISNADIFLDGRTPKEAVNYYGNNHGSIVEIQNQWYVFYHRHTNRIQFDRQACAEKIFFDENGKIPQVEITSCGLNNGPLKTPGKFEARIACNLWGSEGATLYGLGDRPINNSNPYFTQSGVDRECNPDQYIANVNNGSVIGFKYFDIQELKNIEIIAKGNANGKMEVFDNLASSPIVSIPINPSKKWLCFKGTTEKNIPFNRTIPLYFKFIGTGAFDFKAFEIK